MLLKKYVMVLDKPAGPLTALVPKLQTLGFRVVAVPDPAAAQDFVRLFPKLSLVALNESIDRDGTRAVLDVIRQLQPELPVLWLGAADALLGDNPLEVQLSEPPQAEQLGRHAERALCHRLYPDDMIQALTIAATEALSAFGSYVVAREPFLKASRRQLAELSALIAFSGTSISGHLIVGCERSVAQEAHQRLFNDEHAAEVEVLADLLGEVCNRALGRFEEYFERRGMPFTFGTPLYIHGASSQLWDHSRRPSLGLELEGVGGPLFVEFSVDAFDPIDVPPEVPGDLLKSGQFIIL